MATWMALHRLRLERPGRSAARELAAHSNRGVHRRRRTILHGGVCQCHRIDDGAPPNFRSARPRDAPALRSYTDDGRDCRGPRIWRARRTKSAPVETAPRRGRASECSAATKVRSSVHEKNIRSIHAVERNCAASRRLSNMWHRRIKSSIRSGAAPRSANLAGKLDAEPRASGRGKPPIRRKFVRIDNDGTYVVYST